MDEAMKKKVLIGIAVGCIAIAVIITIATIHSRGLIGSKPSSFGKLLMCANPQCGHTFELSPNELAKMMQEKGPIMPMLGMEMPAFKCPKCGQMSAYLAMKCDKCGNVFIPDMNDPKCYDKCPKCGFSKYEELNKQKE